MSKTDLYVGLDNDTYGGMTPVGKIIRDAWVFGLIPETETCEGWNRTRIQSLYQLVNDEWDKYGCLASQLPEELRDKHARIYQQAIATAKAMGWDGENETADDK